MLLTILALSSSMAAHLPTQTGSYELVPASDRISIFVSDVVVPPGTLPGWGYSLAGEDEIEAILTGAKIGDCTATGCDCTSMTSFTSTWSACNTTAATSEAEYQSIFKAVIDEVSGAQREAIYFLPTGGPSTPIGIVYLLHGNKGSWCSFLDVYGGAKLLEDLRNEGYIVVLPEGRGVDWDPTPAPNPLGGIATWSETCMTDLQVETTTERWRSRWEFSNADLDNNGLVDDVELIANLHGAVVEKEFYEGIGTHLDDLRIVGASDGSGHAFTTAYELNHGPYLGNGMQFDVPNVVGIMNTGRAIGQITQDNPTKPYDVPTMFAYGQNDNRFRDLEFFAIQHMAPGTPWYAEIAYRTKVNLPWLTGLQVGGDVMLDTPMAAGLITALNDGSFAGLDLLDNDEQLETELWLRAVQASPPLFNLNARDMEILRTTLLVADANHIPHPDWNAAIIDFLATTSPTSALAPPCTIDPAETRSWNKLTGLKAASGNDQIELASMPLDDLYPDPIIPKQSEEMSVCVDDPDRFQFEQPATTKSCISVVRATNSHDLELRLTAYELNPPSSILATATTTPTTPAFVMVPAFANTTDIGITVEVLGAVDYQPMTPVGNYPGDGNRYVLIKEECP